jgi:hypothetical protein
MAKKIISMLSTYGYSSYQMPQKILEEDTEFDGMIQPAGQPNPEWAKYSTAMEIGVVEGRRYYSVVKECTLEMLQSTIDFENHPNLTLEHYDIREEQFSIELVKRFINLDENYEDIIKSLESFGFFDQVENLDLIKSELHSIIEELKKPKEEQSSDSTVGITST